MSPNRMSDLQKNSEQQFKLLMTRLDQIVTCLLKISETNQNVEALLLEIGTNIEEALSSVDISIEENCSHDDEMLEDIDELEADDDDGESWKR